VRCIGVAQATSTGLPAGARMPASAAPQSRGHSWNVSHIPIAEELDESGSLFGRAAHTRLRWPPAQAVELSAAGQADPSRSPCRRSSRRTAAPAHLLAGAAQRASRRGARTSRTTVRPARCRPGANRVATSFPPSSSRAGALAKRRRPRRCCALEPAGSGAGAAHLATHGHSPAAAGLPPHPPAPVRRGPPRCRPGAPTTGCARPDHGESRAPCTASAG